MERAPVRDSLPSFSDDESNQSIQCVRD
jgi:hypothetical protein